MKHDDAAARIASIEDVRQHLAVILRRVNADARLALRAAANPILALEELGYEIDPAVRPALERRARHSAQDAARLDQLERTVHELARERFDLASTTELSRVLFEKLGLPRPREQQRVPLARELAAASRPAPVADVAAQPRHLVARPKHPDPLEPLRDAHAVMKPLLEWRAIEARHPPLATRELYERLGRDDAPVPSLRLTFRFRRRDEGGEART